MARRDDWKFWWICQYCDHLTQHIVNECPGQTRVLGRCSVCSGLVEIGSQHRQCRF